MLNENGVFENQFISVTDTAGLIGANPAMSLLRKEKPMPITGLDNMNVAESAVAERNENAGAKPPPMSSGTL